MDDLLFTVNSYIKFCEDLIIPQKCVKLFPNSKPWLSSQVRQAILNKKKLCKSLSKQDLAKANNEIKKKVKECKQTYKSKIETNFMSNDMSSVWRGLKQVTGYECNKNRVNALNERDYANELNDFYARFDQHDFSQAHKQIRDNCCKDTYNNTSNFNTHDVCKQFNLVNQNKASGPDDISCKLLKVCSEQLAYIFTYVFNQSFNTHYIPKEWKTSKILPVPKKSKISQLNDLRPVALTSVVFKCFEKLVLKDLIKQVEHQLDPCQFAYKPNRNVEDAVLVFLNNVLVHLDEGRRFVRALFIDFSSAFNTIQPHLLFEKLTSFGVSSELKAWLFDFLTCRTQFVQINNTQSNVIVTNTGAPQGCVLSPVLYTLYTNDCTLANNNNVHLLKFADDSTIQGLITFDDNDYVDCVSSFAAWCDSNFLFLNVTKTKELIFDFRRTKDPINPLFINNQEVEIVNAIKYLGITIDDKLNWHTNTQTIYKKVNQRMYFLRKLRSLNISNNILKLFYTATIQSVISFGIVCWGGNMCEQDKIKINSLIRKARKICNADDLPLVDEIFKIACIKKGESILQDPEHPLNKEYLRSSRSNRLLFKRTKTERLRRSFVPTSIRMLQ